ncbi:MAG: helix-turn-helix transcriptional regulator [Smithella sp.]|jgi:transcriptional regulator with XRE-family HTH domain
MKNTVKKKVSHLELVKKALKERGWRAAELSRRSGVSTGILSRYLNEVLGTSDDNLFAILCTLDLINIPKITVMRGWSQTAIEACNDIREILDFGEKEEKDAVLAAIKQAKKIRSLKKSNAGLSLARRKKTFGKRMAM